MRNFSFSMVVGERWYLCVIFAATLASCSLSVLPDVRASKSNEESNSLADDLEKCCVFEPPAITNCSWRGENDSVRLCKIRKYSDSGNLQACYYTLSPPEKDKYPAPVDEMKTEPFHVKCLPKNRSDAATCSKFYGHYFTGINISISVFPHTAIFTKGLMISILGVSPTSRHLWNRWCRVFEFETTPGYDEIKNGHQFYFDGFRWLDPGASYQVTVRTLPIDNNHNNEVQEVVELPSCTTVPDTYYCHSAAHWQPRVLDVHPDWQMVNVTFDLAPEAYQFDKYCVSLKNMANNQTMQEKDVIPDPSSIIKKQMNGTNATCEVVSTTLGDIPPGSYVIELQPQPSQLVCKDSMNNPVKCKKTGSPAFIVSGPTKSEVGVTVADGTQVKETPTSDVPYASSPVRRGPGQTWLPIFLGCIAGILALTLLFCMIQRSKKQDDSSDNSSKWIWKIPVAMPSDLKISQESLQKLREKEEEFLRKQSENESSRRRITSNHVRNPMELEPLLLPGQEPSSRQLSKNLKSTGSCSQLGREFFSGSFSSLNTDRYTIEFMHLMYTGTHVRKSISSLGTVETNRGSLSRLVRHNSKPDLVSRWLDTCPSLNSQQQNALKRIANSCPNLLLLQNEDSHPIL